MSQICLYTLKFLRVLSIAFALTNVGNVAAWGQSADRGPLKVEGGFFRIPIVRLDFECYGVRGWSWSQATSERCQNQIREIEALIEIGAVRIGEPVWKATSDVAPNQSLGRDEKVFLARRVNNRDLASNGLPDFPPDGKAVAAFFGRCAFLGQAEWNAVERDGVLYAENATTLFTQVAEPGCANSKLESQKASDADEAQITEDSAKSVYSARPIVIERMTDPRINADLVAIDCGLHGGWRVLQYGESLQPTCRLLVEQTLQWPLGLVEAARGNPELIRLYFDQIQVIDIPVSSDRIKLTRFVIKNLPCQIVVSASDDQRSADAIASAIVENSDNVAAFLSDAEAVVSSLTEHASQCLSGEASRIIGAGEGGVIANAAAGMIWDRGLGSLTAMTFETPLGVLSTSSRAVDRARTWTWSVRRAEVGSQLDSTVTYVFAPVSQSSGYAGLRDDLISAAAQ